MRNRLQADHLQQGTGAVACAQIVVSLGTSIARRIRCTSTSSVNSICAFMRGCLNREMTASPTLRSTHLLATSMSSSSNLGLSAATRTLRHAHALSQRSVKSFSQYLSSGLQVLWLNFLRSRPQLRATVENLTLARRPHDPCPSVTRLYCPSLVQELLCALTALFSGLCALTAFGRRTSCFCALTAQSKNKTAQCSGSRARLRGPERHVQKPATSTQNHRGAFLKESEHANQTLHIEAQRVFASLPVSS